jgi:hypothetical protein
VTDAPPHPPRIAKAPGLVTRKPVRHERAEPPNLHQIAKHELTAVEPDEAK